MQAQKEHREGSKFKMQFFRWQAHFSFYTTKRALHLHPELIQLFLQITIQMIHSELLEHANQYEDKIEKDIETKDVHN